MDEHQMKDEALRLALEDLEHFEKAGLATLRTIDAIIAIKKVLEQPEPEPVAWMTPTGVLYRTEDVDGCFDETHIPLYTTPPQPEPEPSKPS